MTEAEMMADLAAADAAGDTALAQHIAGRIKAMRAPPPTPPGIGESLARGAGQGATLGFGDEINAGVQALGIKALGQTGAEKSLGQLYKENRDAFRRENEAAKAAHPWVYGGGQMVGGAPLALASGGLGTPTGALVGTGAALGGASALGESNEEGLGGQALDTAKGAALGGAIPAAVTGAGALLRRAAPVAREAAGGMLLRMLGNTLGIGRKTPLASPEAAAQGLEQVVAAPLAGEHTVRQRFVEAMKNLAQQREGIVNTLDESGIKSAYLEHPVRQLEEAKAQALATAVDKGGVARAYDKAIAALRDRMAAPGLRELPSTAASVEGASLVPSAPKDVPAVGTQFGFRYKPKPTQLPLGYQPGTRAKVLLNAPAEEAVAGRAFNEGPAVEFPQHHGPTHELVPPQNQIPIGQMEEITRNMQEAAKPAYAGSEKEAAKAFEDAARITRSSTSDALAWQAANASPEAQTAAAAYDPTMNKLGNAIELSRLAEEGQNRAAARTKFFNMRNLLMSSALAGGGALSHGPMGAMEGVLIGPAIEHSVGQYMTPAAIKGLGSFANLVERPTPAQQMALARAAALRRIVLPLAAEEAGGSTSR